MNRNKLFLAALVLVVAGSAAAQSNKTGILGTVGEHLEVRDVESSSRTSVSLETGGISVPYYMIALWLVFLTVTVYATDIDPFWIALLLIGAGLGIGSTWAGLPTAVIPVILIAVLALGYTS
ncbi:MAG: hypothetical protein ABEJ03_03415 [Candidatus Nanohaloarchaea archaeon]